MAIRQQAIKRRSVMGMVIVGALLAAAAPAQRRPAGEVEKRADIAVQTIAYGSHALQTLDFYPAPSAVRAPLVMFVHGGGWQRGDKQMMRGSAKLSDWRTAGYAVASLNYRLVPGARVEDQAADVAAAVAVLRRRAVSLGIDPARIVLAGHSAGAHLAVLVGTDPQYLRAAGLGLDAVRGIVALDGAGYHVPSQMGRNERVLGNSYAQAFGTDPARQLALSPTRHAAAPNAPAFLILHVERADSAAQGAGLAAALRRAGTPVELHAIPGAGLAGHRAINQRLGDPSYPATAVVDAWLARVFPR